MKIHLVTHNKHKFEEYRLLFKNENMEIEWVNTEYVEIQDDDVENVALFSLNALTGKIHEPFMLEDSGLYIKSLKGFPGPYSSYVNRTIGNEGIMDLMKNIRERQAVFVAVIGLRMDGQNYLFRGVTEGKISNEIKGKKGFGFDPIFIPEGSERTFSEMDIEEKNRYSHRMRAFKKLIEFLKI
ncbi:MAG: XTP/dITP diphosphatase [Thermoplasmata archaeon]